ncbi:MAG: AzlD domain-containing protein [Rhodobacteraceae bacterium]|nr:AzlD domain-containing protein [Paracoccaceae bacterium]
MIYSSTETWLIIILLGIGTFLIRFSFLGLIGNRSVPPHVLRHLRYTTVGVLPALITPMVSWPVETGGTTDPSRLAAAAAALATGYLTRNSIWAIIAGLVVLYAMLRIAV